jgi:tripartite-type tricarboxylate transporter receptor subunit TctC
VRALGVSSATRLPSAPEIPPLADAGVPGFDAAGWGMIVAPAGTPQEIVSKLHTYLKNVAALPDFQQQVIRLGIVPVSTPAPDKLQDFINSEMARWAKVVHQAGLAGSE